MLSHPVIFLPFIIPHPTLKRNEKIQKFLKKQCPQSLDFVGFLTNLVVFLTSKSKDRPSQEKTGKEHNQIDEKKQP